MRPSNRLIGPLIAVALLLGVTTASFAQQGHNPESAAPPQATPGVSDTWEVTDVRAVGDTRIVALSPDGRSLAGTNRGNQFCVWTIATMEEACDAETLPIHLESIAWAPDSSAVAYSLDAFRFAYESDIYLFELDAGRSVNLTEDELEGGLMGLDETSVPIDVMPAWTSDSQSLTFARTDWAAEDRGTDLMTIAREGGAPELRFIIADDLPLAVFTPMHSLADGSLLYAVTTTGVNDPETGLWLLDGGDASQVMPGSGDDAYPMPAIADVAEGAGGTMIAGYSLTAISQFNMDKPFSFLLDLESGETTPLAHPEDEGVMLGPAGFSPDGSALITSSLNAENGEAVILGE